MYMLHECDRCGGKICTLHGDRCDECIKKVAANVLKAKPAVALLRTVFPDLAAINDFDTKFTAIMKFMGTVSPNSPIFTEPNDRSVENGMEYVIEQVTSAILCGEVDEADDDGSDEE